MGGRSKDEISGTGEEYVCRQAVFECVLSYWSRFRCNPCTKVTEA